MATTTKAKTKTKARKKYDGPTGEEKLVMELVELMQRRQSMEERLGRHSSFRNLITGHEYQEPTLQFCICTCRPGSSPCRCSVVLAKPRKQGLVSARVQACYILASAMHSEAKDKTES